MHKIIAQQKLETLPINYASEEIKQFSNDTKFLSTLSGGTTSMIKKIKEGGGPGPKTSIGDCMDALSETLNKYTATLVTISKQLAGTSLSLAEIRLLIEAIGKFKLACETLQSVITFEKIDSETFKKALAAREAISTEVAKLLLEILSTHLKSLTESEARIRETRSQAPETSFENVEKLTSIHQVAKSLSKYTQIPETYTTQFTISFSESALNFLNAELRGFHYAATSKNIDDIHNLTRTFQRTCIVINSLREVRPLKIESNIATTIKLTLTMIAFREAEIAESLAKKLKLKVLKLNSQMNGKDFYKVCDAIAILVHIQVKSTESDIIICVRHLLSRDADKMPDRVKNLAKTLNTPHDDEFWTAFIDLTNMLKAYSKILVMVSKLKIEVDEKKKIDYFASIIKNSKKPLGILFKKAKTMSNEKERFSFLNFTAAIKTLCISLSSPIFGRKADEFKKTKTKCGKIKDLLNNGPKPKQRKSFLLKRGPKRRSRHKRRATFSSFAFGKLGKGLTSKSTESENDFGAVLAMSRQFEQKAYPDKAQKTKE